MRSVAMAAVTLAAATIVVLCAASRRLRTDRLSAPLVSPSVWQPGGAKADADDEYGSALGPLQALCICTDDWPQ